MASPPPITPPRGADARLFLAAVRLVADGKVAAGISAWRRLPAAVTASPSAAAVRALFLSTVDGHGPPRTSPSAATADPPSEAWALAWADDRAGAGELAARAFASNADPSEAAALLGVLALLERKPERALELLSRAPAGRMDLALHRARALGQLGRLEEAKSVLAKLGRDGFACRVVSALIHARNEASRRGFKPWIANVRASEHHFNGLFLSELPALFDGAELERACSSGEALVGLLEGLLDRMAGNLGDVPTVAEVTQDGHRRFVRLELPPTPRAAALQALSEFSRRGEEAAEAAFAALLGRFPRSPQAYTHRGELRLWSGRYDDALDDFRAARQIEPVRWAYVGAVAGLTFTGRFELAQEAADEAARLPPAPGSTLPVYRGVLRRRMGDLPGAIADLTEAVEAKPTRLGARMELCLALRGAGQRTQAVAHAGWILRDAAPLLVDAADACGLAWSADPGLLVADEVLEDALRAMRGNRSSSIVTWFDRAGSLRLLKRVGMLTEDAQKILSTWRGRVPVAG